MAVIYRDDIYHQGGTNILEECFFYISIIVCGHHLILVICKCCKEFRKVDVLSVGVLICHSKFFHVFQLG